MAAAPKDTTITVREHQRRAPAPKPATPPAPPNEFQRAKGVAIGTIQDLIHGGQELGNMAQGALNTVREGVNKIKAAVKP